MADLFAWEAQLYKNIQFSTWQSKQHQMLLEIHISDSELIHFNGFPRGIQSDKRDQLLQLLSFWDALNDASY